MKKGVKKSYNKKQCGTVKISLLVPIIGAICFLFFGILTIISIITKVDTMTYIVLGFFCGMSLLMILTINQKIEYSPTGFTYRTMLRITHKYNYSQITKISYSKDVIIHIKHRIILIDSMADNGKKFARIAMQYSKNARIITDGTSKLFNGNIKNPGEFIFVYILIGLLPILFFVWILFDSKEIRLENLDVYSSTVSDYCFDKVEEDADRIEIKFDGNENAFISWMIDNNTPEYEEFQKDAEEKKTFDVYYFDDDKTEEGKIIIHQLSCDGKIYVSLESENDINREMRTVFLVFTLIVLGFWGLYIIISSYVMCNAEKYPRLIKLFVKPSYIVWKEK